MSGGAWAQLRTRAQEVQLAVMLLTRLPVGDLPRPAPSLAASVWAYPLAGLVLGGLAGAVLAGALAVGLAPPLAAGFALAVQVIVTGALHEDGLADMADGIWGGRDVARRLEIMRDSRIGSYGVVALVLSLGLRWQVLAYLATLGPAVAAAGLVALAMSSRVAPGVLMAWLAPARSDGMGHRAAGVQVPRVLAAAALGFGLPVLLGLPMAPVLLVQAGLVFGLGRLAQARLGGQTGDVLGASQQLAEIGGGLVLCAILS